MLNLFYPIDNVFGIIYLVIGTHLLCLYSEWAATDSY
jgi:hypothetical protein